MKKYVRKVAYHETDRMGITHHSNYIKWMEEARIYYLEQIGCGYAEMEAMGIVSPVTDVECHYKNPTTFNDIIEVAVAIEEYSGVRLRFGYEMINASSGATVATGRSSHCFTNANGKPIILKKKFPSVDERLRENIVKKEEK